MRIRTTVVGGGLTLLVLASYWLGAMIGLVGFGGGAGDATIDAKSSTETSPAESPAPKEEVSESEPVNPISDGALTVRIDGAQLTVAGKKTTASAIADLARAHDAWVLIVRAEDATRGAREDLEKTLDERQIFYRVQ